MKSLLRKRSPKFKLVFLFPNKKSLKDNWEYYVDPIQLYAGLAWPTSA